MVQDVNFALKSGDGLGIIGPSASGKTSLARLIVGVWQPVRGKVRLDGAALDQWSPERLAGISAICLRTLNCSTAPSPRTSVGSKLTPDAEAIIAAARAAGVHELIVRLPEGYETKIGETGAALSAGQRQRIALARALYRDPFLVVLDEPNSNLDAEGEEALTKAISGVRSRGGIVIVIAHRANAILPQLISVLVLNQGRQQAFGPRDEVLRQVLRPAAPAVNGGGPGRSRQFMTAAPSPSRHSIRRHLLLGAIVAAGLVAGIAGWAATAELSGAVIATGVVVVESDVKKVQHPTGGIVGELRVRDDQRVNEGDVLVRLDETQTRRTWPSLPRALTSSLPATRASRRRRTALQSIQFPEDLLGARSDRSRGRPHPSQASASSSVFAWKRATGRRRS